MGTNKPFPRPIPLGVIGSAGHQIKHTEFKVVDSESDEVLPPSSKGILKVRGPQLMKGYYKNILNEFGEGLDHTVLSFGLAITMYMNHINDIMDPAILVGLKEHWRFKHGSGYTLYPRSLLTINCTGDVCMGDVVLFRQKVYEKFHKVTQHGKTLGNRTVCWEGCEGELWCS